MFYECETCKYVIGINEYHLQCSLCDKIACGSCDDYYLICYQCGEVLCETCGKKNLQNGVCDKCTIDNIHSLTEVSHDYHSC